MHDVLYNEIDAYAAAWLRNLAAAGHLPAGHVDERSILDLDPDDVRSFRQCHFFAGIGGWPYALRLAGWPDDREVWTGSCPCQPFSSAGQRRGKADERHLWPHFLRLIRECRPAVIFGEQVSGAGGREWLGGDPGLQRVLDREAGYRVLRTAERASEDLQRLFAIDRTRPRRRSERTEISGSEEISEGEPSEGIDPLGETESTKERFALQLGRGAYSRCNRCGRLRVDGYSLQFGWREDLGQSVSGQDQFQTRLFEEQCACGAPLPQRDGERMGREQDHRNSRRDNGATPVSFGTIAGTLGIRIEAADQFRELAGVRADLEHLGYAVGAADLSATGVGAPHIRQRGLGDTDTARSQGRREHAGEYADQRPAGPTGHWADAVWLPCLDGRARRVEPGVFPLAHGVSARVGRLRAYGNAVVPQVAAAFVRAYGGLT